MDQHYVLSELSTDIACAHLGAKNNKKTNELNGVFPAMCQPQTLDAAIRNMKTLPMGPLIQVGHWVASPFPTQKVAYFVHPDATDNENKFVLFTPLAGNANFVKMTSNIPKTFRNLSSIKCDLVAGDIATGSIFQPVPLNTWIPASKFVFQIIPSCVPGAIVVHKSLPYKLAYTVEEFAIGSTTVWNPLNNDDVFTPRCRVENMRYQKGPFVLSDALKRALEGTLLQTDIGAEVVEDSTKNLHLLADVAMDVEPDKQEPTTVYTLPVVPDLSKVTIDMIITSLKLLGPEAPGFACGQP
jgi:hypothetical protein